MTIELFKQQYDELLRQVYQRGVVVPSTTWQSQKIAGRPGMSFSRELQHVTFKLRVPETIPELQNLVQPNLPWAEDHLLERVSGEPLNPPPSEAWWPFRVQGNAEHKDEAQQFSHTYPERMWPKYANSGNTRPNGRQVFVPHNGIRYEYGDLVDLIVLLKKDILTRQAYLPIWFPEDTGAVDGQRVPCTLGYHFLFRPGYFPGEYQGHLVYYIRSCDLLRHFTDDVYMACRLFQHVSGTLREHGINAHPSLLVMHISSLHTFEGDDPIICSTLGIKPKVEDEDDDVIYGV